MEPDTQARIAGMQISQEPSSRVSSPRGHLQSITTTLTRLARKGDVDGIRAYVRGDAFLTAIKGVDPERRSCVMRCYARTETLCELRARRPLAKPKRIDARRAEKVAWSDPAMRAKLASAYAQAGGDDEKAARILGVSLGSARLARKRHLGAATDQGQNAVVAAGMAICVEGTPPPASPA